MALARFLPTWVGNGERVGQSYWTTNDDLYVKALGEITRKGMRRPLMRNLEGLLWEELESARAETTASIELRINIGSGTDHFARLYGQCLRTNPAHYWALFAGGLISLPQPFDFGQAPYSPNEHDRQIRATLRSEYSDALLPGFESYRLEKEAAQRRGRSTAEPLSARQPDGEASEEFEECAEWLLGHSQSPSSHTLVRRVAVRYSLSPREWRQGLLAFSFDSALLDRLAGQKRGWANKRKQRFLANARLTPRAQRLLVAHQVVESTVSTQRVAWSYVSGLPGRSFPSALPISRAKETRTMPDRNGHEPAGDWKVWTFTAYEPDGPATWWAYENGAAPIYARTKERLVKKVLAEDRR
jgi:hypothetical protein